MNASLLKPISIILATALVGFGCGDDDDDNETPQTPQTQTPAQDDADDPAAPDETAQVPGTGLPPGVTVPTDEDIDQVTGLDDLTAQDLEVVACHELVVISLATDGMDISALTFVIVDAPMHAAVFELTGSEVAFLSEDDFIGTDEFTFFVTDGERESNVATVTIFVDPHAEDLGLIQ